MAVALRGLQGEGDAASALDVPVWTGALAGATAIQPQDPSSPLMGPVHALCGPKSGQRQRR